MCACFICYYCIFVNVYSCTLRLNFMGKYVKDRQGDRQIDMLTNIIFWQINKTSKLVWSCFFWRKQHEKANVHKIFIVCFLIKKHRKDGTYAPKKKTLLVIYFKTSMSIVSLRAGCLYRSSSSVFYSWIVWKLFWKYEWIFCRKTAVFLK